MRNPDQKIMSLTLPLFLTLTRGELQTRHQISFQCTETGGVSAAELCRAGIPPTPPAASCSWPRLLAEGSDPAWSMAYLGLFLSQEQVAKAGGPGDVWGCPQMAPSTGPIPWQQLGEHRGQRSSRALLPQSQESPEQRELLL